MNPLLAKLQPYPFEKLRALTAGATPNPALKPLNLSIGEPKHPTPALVKDALTRALDGLAAYPLTIGSPQLRQAIAAWLARRYGIPQPDPETEVLPINGSREALFAFAQTVIDPTRAAKVVCPNPFYQIYEGAALLAGAIPVYGTPGSWDGVQLVYVCSPANPSGHVMGLDEWRQVLEKAVELKPFRTHLDEIRFEVTSLSAVTKGLAGRRSRHPVPVRVGRDAALHLEGTLHVRGHSRRSSLDDAEVTLTAVHSPTGRFADLPLKVRRVSEGFRVSTTVPLPDVLGGEESLDGVRLRLRFVWQNSAWDAFVQRPAAPEPGVEVAYALDDALELNFR